MSTSSNFNQDWTKEKWCNGDGFIIEGTVKKVKVHSMFISSKPAVHHTPLPTRFVSITVEVDQCIKRNYKDGVEVPPKMVRATAIAKGYLNKFERVQSQLVEKVDSNALAKAVGSPTGKALPIGFHDDSLPSLHPSTPNIFEFWADAEKFSHKDTKVGDEIRIKTIGNSIFLESVVKMDSQQISNFSGDQQLGSSWTNQIMKHADKDEAPSKKFQPTKQKEFQQDDDEEQDWS
ncbi:hypothetical protein DFA_00103 [Cavenderia fasciculata]|uniref:Arpin n=1 Tax=Cavenderia fasciculata TaxID=261658 RepID=F4PXL5_CACFS|nr:uncharacterized protein DFA_00103 [Cavenderia fasciculata]EGG19525.1 hypothetical protein DFA_00103 [Cavenderia fasciculata]|eukprot:XP_004357819.1 hypothetical protein DFA_00103 [Cavenderia fasciculata]